MTFRVSMNDFLWGSDSGCDEKRCDNGSKSIMHLSPGALAQSVRCAAFWGLSRTFRVLFCCTEANGYDSLLKIYERQGCCACEILWNEIGLLCCFSEKKELRFFSTVMQNRVVLPCLFKVGKLRHTTVNLHRQRQVAKPSFFPVPFLSCKESNTAGNTSSFTAQAQIIFKHVSY